MRFLSLVLALLLMFFVSGVFADGPSDLNSPTIQLSNDSNSAPTDVPLPLDSDADKYDGMTVNSFIGSAANNVKQHPWPWGIVGTLAGFFSLRGVKQGLSYLVTQTSVAEVTGTSIGVAGLYAFVNAVCFGNGGSQGAYIVTNVVLTSILSVVVAIALNAMGWEARKGDQ